MPAKLNLLGQKFGTLTVVEELSTTIINGKTRKGTFWKCSCTCGGEVISGAGYLRRSIRSCTQCKTRATAHEVEGKVFSTKYYGDFKVTKYIDSKNVEVEFLSTGYKRTSQLKEVRLAVIKDPLYPSVFGVGYHGIGPHNGWVKVDGKSKNSQAYETWIGMLKRCYSDNEKFRSKHPAYNDVTVCGEWFNFQTFAEWFYKNKPDYAQLELDKDLKVLGSKIYSPETCSFVPSQVNSLFTGYGEDRGLMRGVHWCNTKGKYIVQLHVGEKTKAGNNKQSYLGAYDSKEVAEGVYVKHKVQHAIEVANKYKKFIEPEVYNNIVNKTIEFLK